jgi:hypothetical protein
MADATTDKNAEFRAQLARNLVTNASYGVLLLGAIVLAAAGWSQYQTPNSPVLKEAAQLIFTSILPLLGTWVGTVLAFYFTKESLEAANRTTLETIRSVSQRLEGTRVADKMIPASAIIHATIPAGNKINDLTIKEVEQLFDKPLPNGQKITRLLVVDSDGACGGIIHRSVWMEMLNLGLKQTTPVVPATDTITRLLELPYASPVSKNFGEFIKATLAYVGLDRTVADAKAAMEATPQCQDVIITATGKREEAMRGWISNVEIARLSQA